MKRDARDAPLRFLRMLIVAFLFGIVWPVVMGGRMLWFWLRGER